MNGQGRNKGGNWVPQPCTRLRLLQCRSVTVNIMYERQFIVCVFNTALIYSTLLWPQRICNTTNSSNFSSIYELDWSKFLSHWTTKHNFTTTKWSDTSFINLHTQWCLKKQCIHVTTTRYVDATDMCSKNTAKNKLHNHYINHTISIC